MAVGNIAVELLKWLLKYHPSVSQYLSVCSKMYLRKGGVGGGAGVKIKIQFKRTLLSLCRKICLLARHLHKTFNTSYNKTSTISYSQSCLRASAEETAESSVRVGLYLYIYIGPCLYTWGVSRFGLAVRR